MNIVNEIMDFFIRLVRGRLDQVEMQAKSKMMNVQHQAKSAASKQFNQAVDGAVGKAKSAATGKPVAPQADKTPKR